ncbi:MAG: hypothetical protein A2Y17_10990 [Clostridiales bacterium GWF2_38_85]|nr:MAG: hypothetical protein A2Y17_10990 [Clostridiales bacterium GWF2_38_85]HBL84652.1 hypothetical protein [Clostridiales bacterium]
MKKYEILKQFSNINEWFILEAEPEIKDIKSERKQNSNRTLLIKKISVVAACVLLCVGIIIPLAYNFNGMMPPVTDNSETNSTGSNPAVSETNSEPTVSQPDETSKSEVGDVIYNNKITNSSVAEAFVHPYSVDNIKYELLMILNDKNYDPSTNQWSIPKYSDDQLFRIAFSFDDPTLYKDLIIDGYLWKMLTEKIQNTLKESDEIEDEKIFQELYYNLYPTIQKFNIEKGIMNIPVIEAMDFKDFEVINDYYFNKNYYVATFSKEEIIKLCKEDSRFFAIDIGSDVRPSGYPENVQTQLACELETAEDGDIFNIRYCPLEYQFDFTGIDQEKNAEISASLIKFAEANNINYIKLWNNNICYLQIEATKSEIMDLINKGVPYIGYEPEVIISLA